MTAEPCAHEQLRATHASVCCEQCGKTLVRLGETARIDSRTTITLRRGEDGEVLLERYRDNG